MRLQNAWDSMTHVRIERRPRHADRIDGYVVGIGAKWALVARLMDGGYFDGFSAIRLRDIRDVDRDRSFQGSFARTQPEWPPTAPGPIDLDSTSGVIRSLAATAPLIGIEKENERSAMWIGEVVDLQRGGVQLREVRPDARWRTKQLWYELSAVTTASVGSHYLTGLAAVSLPAVPAIHEASRASA